MTSGAFDQSGARFFPLHRPCHDELEILARERILREIHERGLLPAERLRLLRSWRRSGFSVHVGRPIAPSDVAALERRARYVRRLHLADSRVLYDEARDRVIYGSGKSPHPGFKANFRVFEARDFVADVTGFVPDTYRHESIAYGDYSNAVRGRRRRGEAPPRTPELAEPRPARAVRSAWRELIRRVYEVDPLACPRGGELRLVGFVTEATTIERLLRHLGLWPPPRRPPKPPPPEREPDKAPRAPAQARLPAPPSEEADSQVPPWWDHEAAYSELAPSPEE